MVVQHNLTAMNANRYLGINNNKLSKSLEKLSSGYAINRAGDNAAGLAVSEKMRSQIAGMTQGVKNAQDGISMVQTFEGALTETHSILQRMKTLADQMANGSYDDPIDRTAAQQEFLQLNDELDQIADTDFNGVIVLNGGKMADGLEAVDGMFDYANKADQVKAANEKALADAQAAAQEKIDNAQKAFDAAKAVYDNTSGRDRCLSGEAVGFNTVDNNQYGKTEADALFNAVVIKDGDATDATKTDAAGNAISKDSLTAQGIESIEVTFKYDEATSSWKVESGSYKDSDQKTQEIDKASLEGFLDGGDATADAAGTNIVTTTNGGFIVGGGKTPTEKNSTNAQYGNVVFDGADIKDGDVITLTYTHTDSPSYAPTNIGMDQDSLHIGVKDASKPTLTLDAGITNANMNDETAAALDKLNNANVEFAYSGTGIAATIDQDGLEITETGTNTGVFTVSFKNSEGATVKLASITTDKAAGATKASTGAIATADAEKKADASYQGKTYKHNGTNWYLSTDTKEDAVTIQSGGTAITINNAQEGDTITIGNDGTMTYTQAPATDGTVGSIKFGIALDEGKYDVSSVGPTIKPSTTEGGVDSRAIDKAYADTKAALAEAQAAYPKTIDDLGDNYKVSVSDAFNKSEAKLTYKDNITLQVGARTKDAVNFTFQYASTSIGDLKDDLNCTAAGLGTDKLNLNTQEAANYAIDKIDQAINKVSLIRGTFGAIQNRLEHKIDNMNVSIENLTSAESQIRDTNMPTEMMNFTKNQILAQASQSMLAQANQLPQSVLSLLQ